MRSVATQIVQWVLEQPPTLGTGRLVCVDGPSGSGKTTLAAALERHLAPHAVRVVHMDDVYDGWDGLAAAMTTVATTVIEPLRAGLPGRYRRYDWHLGRYAEEHVVEPVDVLLVEGVGSGGSSYGDAITCLVWLDAPSGVRLERGVLRDGEQLREHLLAWRASEQAMFERERTRERADVVVDGVSGAFVSRPAG